MSKIKYILIFIFTLLFILMTIADIKDNNIRISYGKDVRELYINTVADGIIRFTGE